MEIIDKYKRELEEDCKIDMINLRDVQMKLPAIKHKWVARLINHKIERDKIRDFIKEAKAKIIEKKLQQPQSVKLSKVSLDRMADEHPSVIQLKDKVRQEDYAIMYLEHVEQILKSVTFDVKNLIEIMKLEQL